MPTGRPTKYNKEIIRKTHEYIDSCNVDEELTRFVTMQSDNSTSWNYRRTRHHLD